MHHDRNSVGCGSYDPSGSCFGSFLSSCPKLSQSKPPLLQNNHQQHSCCCLLPVHHNHTPKTMPVSPKIFTSSMILKHQIPILLYNIFSTNKTTLQQIINQETSTNMFTNSKKVVPTTSLLLQHLLPKIHGQTPNERKASKTPFHDILSGILSARLQPTQLLLQQFTSCQD